MSDFKVDNGIPLPPSSRGRDSKGNSKYPKLDVGQSFFSTTKQAGNSIGRVWHEQKFAQRKVIENGVTGFRTWRLK